MLACMLIPTGIGCEFLHKEYIVNKKSTYQIGREIGRSSATICKWLKRYNIPRRNSSESHKGQHNSPKTEFKKGQRPWNFKGEIVWRGYVHILAPTHPCRSKQNYVRKHRLVVESFIGRYLTTEEKVHHLNDNKIDNEPNNLMAFSSESAHQRFHHNPNSIVDSEIIFDGRKLC